MPAGSGSISVLRPPVGCCTSRQPSDVRRSDSLRGSDWAPRQVLVGSSLAYCQLLIQPIQIGTAISRGRSANESEA